LLASFHQFWNFDKTLSEKFSKSLFCWYLGKIAVILSEAADALYESQTPKVDPPYPSRVSLLVFPKPPSSLAVFLEWQEWHNGWRFSRSLVPPLANGMI